MEQKQRTYQVGKPIAEEWESLELPDDGTASTTASAITRAAFLADDGRQTYEVWDVTNPDKWRLVVAWPGTRDGAKYDRMCRIPLGPALGRGFHGGHERVSDGAKETLQLTAKLMLRLQRGLAVEAAKGQKGVYSPESAEALDAIANEYLAARQSTASAAD
jgi:hypothetical protein